MTYRPSGRHNFYTVVHPIIFQAEERVAKKGLDKEYAPISGVADFCKAAINLALGENNQISSNGLVINCTYIQSV